MRIACVHIPQFALQCATRIDPSLRRAESPVVVVGPSVASAGPALGPSLHLASATAKPSAPIVLACSRAAWALGARVGMTATAARTLSPLLEVVTADAQLERDTVRAIADVLLDLTPVVDVGGRVGPGGAHLALYCEVPAKTRGTSFGDRLLTHLEALGLTGRIGIADDRFTAWVAAWLGAWDAHDRSSTAPAPTRHDETGVVSVPRGGSAAFLAPRPLSLLSISPEVQHMLEALGVRTLGEFAALPAPTVSSRGARFEADYQALARGESGNVLRPYAPDAPIREDAVLRAHPQHEPHVPSSPTPPHATPTHATPMHAAPMHAAPMHAAPMYAAPRHAAPSHAAPTHAVFAHEHGLSAPAAVALLAERVAMRLAGRARAAARLDITITSAAGERVVTLTPVRDGQGVLSSAEQLADAIGSTLGADSAQAWRLRVVVTGEALAGDLSDAAAAAAADAPYAAYASYTGYAAHAGDAGDAVHAARDARDAVHAGAGHAARGFALPTQRTFATLASAPTAATYERADRADRADSTALLDQPPTAQPSPLADPDVALSIALSTTGGAVERVFGLTSPVASSLAAERRDAHRRTRRGKQRRRTTPAHGAIVQPRLFKM